MPLTPPSSESRDPLAQLEALPGPLRTFLFSRSASEDLKALYKKYQFPADTLDAVVDLIGDIDLGYLPFSELLPTLKGEIGLPETQAKQFAIDLAGLRYLPVAGLLGVSVWDAIKSWGGDPKKFPEKTIAAQKITAPALVAGLLGTVQDVLVPRMQERLRFVLLSRVQGVRDDMETKEMITRAEKIGGVALPPERVEALMDELYRKLATAQIVAEMPPEEKSEIRNPKSENNNGVAKPLPPKPAAKPVAPLLPAPPAPKPRPSLSEALPAAQKFAGPDFEIPGAPRPKDDEEIAAMRDELAKRLPKENDLATRKRTASVENIVRTSGLTLEAALTERFKRIVDARLRDIRDSFETKRILSQVIAAGGLGLAPADADRVANLIEAEYRALFGQGAAEKQREARALEAATRETTVAREVARAASEAQASETRFHKIAEKSRKLKEQEVLLPLTTPSHAATLPAIQPQVSNLKRPRVVLSPASVGPSSANKSKVEDIRVVRKIAGPIDELATMTITEFRRMSKDPQEAALKIRDKIELQKEEGFERYFAAIRAWQSSPVNRLYLALTREALEANVAVPTLIREKTQAAAPTLTIEEFHAILTLNGQLQL